jgi:hypothetical protein
MDQILVVKPRMAAPLVGRHVTKILHNYDKAVIKRRRDGLSNTNDNSPASLEGGKAIPGVAPEAEILRVPRS